MKRHNELRNLLGARARAAGLQPELEKTNLLPPRPELHGGAEDGSDTSGARRPANVWVPHWNLHGPAAFDLAVTSGLRQGHLAASAADGARASADYEVRACRRSNRALLRAFNSGPWSLRLVEVDGSPPPSLRARR